MEGSMLRRAASASAAMVSGYRQGEAVGACTESLGSESGDVGGEDAEIIDQLGPAAGADHEVGEAAAGWGWEGSQASPEKRRRTERRLPPAMPRAAEAFMRAERRGGRLILTEVVRPAERPREVFRASRADGRLLLRFAAADDDDASPAPGSEQETRSNAETSGVVVPAAGCCNCNGAVGFRHATAGGSGATSSVEVCAVMGI